MSKLYQFVSTQFVEAENEDEAKERFADHSFDFAANAECSEACERCLEALGACRCDVSDHRP